MKNSRLLCAVGALAFPLSILSGTAHAGPAPVPTVPEIDVGMAAIGIGLTLGIVALVREHRRKK